MDFTNGGRPQISLRALFQARTGTWVEPPTSFNFMESWIHFIHHMTPLLVKARANVTFMPCCFDFVIFANLTSKSVKLKLSSSYSCYRRNNNQTKSHYTMLLSQWRPHQTRLLIIHFTFDNILHNCGRLTSRKLIVVFKIMKWNL